MVSSLIIVHFLKNVAGFSGGAVYHRASNNSTYRNCTFEGNEGVSGGAMGSTFCEDLNLLNCTFKDNRAERGGALSSNYNDGILIEECDFIQNTATGSAILSPILSGGAIFIWGEEGTISSCIFEGNTALDHGGAIETEGWTYDNEFIDYK